MTPSDVSRSGTSVQSSRKSRSSLTSTNAALQSVEKPDAPDVPGEGKPRVHPLSVEHGLISQYSREVTTLYESFRDGVRRLPDNRLFGTRPVVDGKAGPYEWQTYAHVLKRVSDLASGLSQLNLPDGSRVGLYSINRAEWIIAEQASYARSWTTVPLYDTLGKEAVAYIAEQTEMPLLFASADRAANILKIDEVKAIKQIVVFDPITSELAKQASDRGVELLSLQELEGKGEAAPVPDRPPRSSDLCTICYTSGATGMPKGVQLPHSAMLACVSAIIATMDRNPLHPIPAGRSNYFVDLNEAEVHLSYLPLAHIFERIVVSLLVVVGASIGFYQGDQMKLLDDVEALNPTIFMVVPRVCNRIYDKVRSKIAAKGGIVKWLFDTAYASKLRSLRENNVYTHWLWDRLVFGSIRAKLGNRLRVIISGSAPLSPDVIEFMRICFSCEVYEGFGQTETSAGSSANLYGDWNVSGHVGVPFPCCEFKLVDIPDMSYTSHDEPDPRGEVCIRGPSCFTGYYRDAQKTAEAIDADGWVHTGDVGRWDSEGRLFIIDRKKHIFKLAQGEYIAPERIENVLLKSRYISQAFIFGDSLENSTIAIIVPDAEVLGQWAREQDISGDIALLCRDERVKSLISRSIEAFGKTGSRELTGIEIPRAVLLEPTPFSVENGFLTSTFKCRRSNVVSKYADAFRSLYERARQQTSQTVFVVSK